MLFAEMDWGPIAIQTLVLIGVIFTGYYNLRLKQIEMAKENRTSNEDVANHVGLLKADVHEVKVATDGMKTALVAATALAENLQGQKTGRAELAAEQAAAPMPPATAADVKTAVADAIADNVEIVKQDVKEVKENVQEVRGDVKKLI